MERALVKVSAFLTEQITSARKIVNERSYVLQSRLRALVILETSARMTYRLSEMQITSARMKWNERSYGTDLVRIL